MADYHVPVMLAEVLGYLEPESGKVIIDCTVGGGGHAQEIVKRILPGGKLIGIDLDEEALRAVEDRLKEYKENIILEKGNYSDLENIAERLGLTEVNGILMDLGVSSHQLDIAERGFSFRYDVPLDMRMDVTQPITARDLVNSLSESELADIIWRFGEERWAKRIAKFIVERRARRSIETTGDLVEIIEAAVPPGARPKPIHVGTKTFQAIRIALNRELESLQMGLNAAVDLLAKGGRLCVLSYHSLEDRTVKESFTRYAGKCTCPPRLPICSCGARKVVKVLTKKPVVPSDTEVQMNPRARSAKLRVAEKL